MPRQNLTSISLRSETITTTYLSGTGLYGGEHIHHGYWEDNESVATAQIQLN
jgi:hypothetical protein